MPYWLACVAVFLLAFTLTELIQRRHGTRKVRVTIVDNDGSKRVVIITAGRDSEVDRLVSEAKKASQR